MSVRGSRVPKAAVTRSVLEEHVGLEGLGPVQQVWAGQEVMARAVGQGGRGQARQSRGLL